mmetsp:Transcript_28734/g.57319  ORF Transcript_28734/g.57319 Transcript_28734/m.57319 type:complete len:275 (-) Transcript_28734:1009-1833(-)
MDFYPSLSPHRSVDRRAVCDRIWFHKFSNTCIVIHRRICNQEYFTHFFERIAAVRMSCSRPRPQHYIAGAHVRLHLFFGHLPECLNRPHHILPHRVCPHCALVRYPVRLYSPSTLHIRQSPARPVCIPRPRARVQQCVVGHDVRARRPVSRPAHVAHARHDISGALWVSATTVCRDSGRETRGIGGYVSASIPVPLRHVLEHLLHKGRGVGIPGSTVGESREHLGEGARRRFEFTVPGVSFHERPEEGDGPTRGRAGWTNKAGGDSGVVAPGVG